MKKYYTIVIAHRLNSDPNDVIYKNLGLLDESSIFCCLQDWLLNHAPLDYHEVHLFDKPRDISIFLNNFKY